jgi:TM2 domain-containing membrane protein YozV
MGYQSMMQDDDDLRGSSERTQRRILVETTIANQKKSAGIAYLLWFFFGGFGAHNWYVGKPMLAGAQMFGYIIALAMYFSGNVIFGGLLFIPLGISLILDLCFIPARINAHTERMRESMSDSMVWSD